MSATLTNPTELEGLELTRLELDVAGNPSFLYLRKNGWPHKWGELVTGMQIDPGKSDYHIHLGLEDGINKAFMPSKAKPLLPHAAGVRFDDLAHHMRNVLILAAKVTRDAGDNLHDQQLVRDFSIWLDGLDYPYSTWGFRWERHLARITAIAQHQAWDARVSELRQGTSEVVVILRHRLSRAEMKSLREYFRDVWVIKEFSAFEKEPTFSQVTHLPVVDCLQCDSTELHHGRMGSAGESRCTVPAAIILVDPKDVKAAVSGIPRRFQQNVRIAHFKLPRATFRDPGMQQEDVFANMLVVGMEYLNRAQQKEAEAKARAWLERKQREVANDAFGTSLSKMLASLTILRPHKSAYTNCLIVAGQHMSEEMWLRDPRNGGMDSLQRAFEPFPITATYTHSRGFQ